VRRSNSFALEDRIPKILSAVRSGREKSFNALNGAEMQIVEGAANYRSLDRWANGQATKIIDSTAGWLPKQEMLRFFCSLDREDWDQGLALAKWCSTREIGFDVGVLSRVMAEAKREKLPVEWIAASEIDEKKFRFDENGELIDESKPAPENRLRLDRRLLS